MNGNAVVTYNGPLPQATLSGYGHFQPGESKTVDDLTAMTLDADDLAKKEGWSVEWPAGSKRRADTTKSTKPEEKISSNTKADA